MLFKKKEEQITNSTQIKEILDKSKDISIAEEMGILSYIYSLEEDRKNLSIENKKQKEVLDKIKAKVNQYNFISGYYDDNYDGEDETYSHDTLKEEILELMEEIWK